MGAHTHVFQRVQEAHAQLDQCHISSHPFQHFRPAGCLQCELAHERAVALPKLLPQWRAAGAPPAVLWVTAALRWEPVAKWVPTAASNQCMELHVLPHRHDTTGACSTAGC